MMIRVSNYLLSIVFRLHDHSQKVIGSLRIQCVTNMQNWITSSWFPVKLLHWSHCEIVLSRTRHNDTVSIPATFSFGHADMPTWAADAAFVLAKRTSCAEKTSGGEKRDANTKTICSSLWSVETQHMFWFSIARQYLRIHYNVTLFLETWHALTSQCGPAAIAAIKRVFDL